MSGFLGRLSNLIKGILSIFIGGLENSNPEAVYLQAIDQRTLQYSSLKKAVGGIVALRNKLQTQYDDKNRLFKEVSLQLQAAIETGEDDLALALIEQKEELEADLTTLEGELEKVSQQAEDAKTGLLQFQSDIEKLKREKEQMLAKKANAEARIQIQDTLSGLSTDSDVKALDNVREGIEKLHAEADVSSEINGSTLDARLKKLKGKAGQITARSKLAQLKAAQKARQAGAVSTQKSL